MPSPIPPQPGKSRLVSGQLKAIGAQGYNLFRMMQWHHPIFPFADIENQGSKTIWLWRAVVR